ncbi:hypothetical protein B0H13DRAFT_2057424 [Mycena leptocephala]|nr:hypothetical protein B0H13DRAFT_2057424 [Mycena leptocephala]
MWVQRFVATVLHCGAPASVALTLTQVTQVLAYIKIRSEFPDISFASWLQTRLEYHNRIINDKHHGLHRQWALRMSV